jgi:murein DD-endopeptidase MepM/ murein hydrolase activator NlpD
LIIGEKIIIPGAKTTVKNTNNTKNNTTKKTNSSVGLLMRPVSGGIKTQGIHGNNGVDIGIPVGTSVYAAAGGVISLVRGGDAWNGGYGNYIVVKHPNGVQTLYAHLSSISVNKGETVEKGEVIGRSGNTGRSTGPHLHFEVRGAKNPF